MSSGVRFRASDGTLRNDYPQKFTLADLDELDAALDRASAVIPMRDVAEGLTDLDLVAMRHDVDHDPAHALRFAEWESERGYRSTYFILHSAWYWQEERAETFDVMRAMLELGHEVGLHHDAIGVALEEIGDVQAFIDTEGGWLDDLCGRASKIMREALSAMRDEGFEIVGCVQHGGAAVSVKHLIDGEFKTIPNETLWERFDYADFGLTYEAYHLHRAASRYHSDNHGSWHQGGDHSDVVRSPSTWDWPTDRQHHCLVHPCHWSLL